MVVENSFSFGLGCFAANVESWIQKTFVDAGWDSESKQPVVRFPDILL